VKWGYRCERLDLIPSSDSLSGGPAYKRLVSVVDAFLSPLRRLAHRSTRV
jgi:hypothetical protein